MEIITIPQNIYPTFCTGVKSKTPNFQYITSRFVQKDHEQQVARRKGILIHIYIVIIEPPILESKKEVLSYYILN